MRRLPRQSSLPSVPGWQAEFPPTVDLDGQVPGVPGHVVRRPVVEMDWLRASESSPLSLVAGAASRGPDCAAFAQAPVAEMG